VADNPGRHEPGTGELNYANIFKAIAATNYDGYVALEYGPSKGKTPDDALVNVADCLSQVV
jgi:hydroxypyruvate isomerase